MLLFLIESTEAVRKISAAHGEVCATVPESSSDSNNNNNSGVDFNQQYREWKEMMVAATAARDQAEQEKQVTNQTDRIMLAPALTNLLITTIK